ncbi:hypothetical protein Taro_023559 [Colocasia esculenta]|uniref:pyridoxal kinase n=1 Tax=Colocasia esculenta TaxID=4460 RepID=A0A843VHP3_COLES|nr:hypothetical protein [Colocasia esculenta]
MRCLLPLPSSSLRRSWLGADALPRPSLLRRQSRWRKTSSRKGLLLPMAQPPVLSVALPSETGRVLSIQSHTVQVLAVVPFISSLPCSPYFPKSSFNYEEICSEMFTRQVMVPSSVGYLATSFLSSHCYLDIFAGYIGSVSFLNTILQVVNKLRLVNPSLVYVCDPVMGDEGKLYVPPELVSVYREKVVPVASMLTPNQFEAEQLTGFRITSEEDGLKACDVLHAAGPSKVVITSLNINGDLLLIGSHQKIKGEPPEQFKIVVPKIPAYFTGTGDLMTALLLGWSNKYPDDLGKASEIAVSSLQALLQRTVADYKKVGFDPKSSSLEIRLIQSQDDIRSPQVKFKVDRYSC